MIKMIMIMIVLLYFLHNLILFEGKCLKIASWFLMALKQQQKQQQHIMCVILEWGSHIHY